jgi:hypothetical protein
MLTPAERKELIDEIHALPVRLEKLVVRLKDSQLDEPYAHGKWTVRQVVHHLADAHINGYTRMRLVLTETNPILKPYDQDLFARLSDATELPIAPSLLILKGLHERWTALLEKTPENAWSRAGIHLDNGKMTLDDLLVGYVRHGATHLDQIAGLIKARGW